MEELDNKDRVKYILENYRKAKAKGHNLIIASKSEYSIKSKVAVGRGTSTSKGDSEQEKYISNKEECKENGQALLELSEAIKLSVSSLPQRQRITIQLKYFEGLKPREIGKREKIDRHKRTVERLEKEALKNLIDWGICMIYEEFKRLLDFH